MTTINPTIANSISDFLNKGSSVASGDRFLALTTDTGGTTETADYDGRIDISAVFGSASAGDNTNTSAVGPYTFTLGDTIRGWAIYDDVSAGSYVLRGALGGQPFVVGPLGTFTIGIGDLDTTVDPA